MPPPESAAAIGAKSMKAAPARLIQQGQQGGFEVLHLLFRLGAGLGCIRGEQGTETGDLIRQSVVLSRQDRNLLLGNPGAGLGLIPLVLPKVRSVAPETDGCGFGFVIRTPAEGVGRDSRRLGLRID